MPIKYVTVISEKVYLSGLFFLLEPNPVLFHEFFHHRMVARIKLFDRANEHELAFVKERHPVRNFFRAIGDVVRNDHLREA